MTDIDRVELEKMFRPLKEALSEINDRLNDLENRGPYLREPSDPVKRLYELVEDLNDIIANLEDAEKLRDP